MYIYKAGQHKIETKNKLGKINDIHVGNHRKNVT